MMFGADNGSAVYESSDLGTVIDECTIVFKNRVFQYDSSKTAGTD